jgi:hypothetical protein
MSTTQIRYFPSNQSQKIVKMFCAWHQATAPHLLVSAFTAMELIPFMGETVSFVRALIASGCREFGHGLAKIPIQWKMGKGATKESDYRFSKSLSHLSSS